MELLSKLEKNLEVHLGQISADHRFQEVYRYSLLPAGKMFRPLLVLAAASDYSGQTPDQLLSSSHPSAMCASFVEMHHTYTLMHDDLPCMDDDDFRRGRPSSHKKFSEWQALLGGDGLAIGSFGLLAQIKADLYPEIIRAATWYTGPKGLIQGQVLDLSGDMTNDFETLIETHRLKTARLIQCSLVLGMLSVQCLSSIESASGHRRKLHRLGDALGITFQLLDDLTEICEANVSQREFEVSPLFNFSNKFEDELCRQLKVISELIDPKTMPQIHNVVSNYLRKTGQKITSGRKFVDQHLSDQQVQIDLERILKLLS